MTSTNINEALNTIGSKIKLAGQSTGEKETINWDQPDGRNFAVYTFQESDAALTAINWTVDNTLYPIETMIDKNGSTTNFKIADPNFTISDFDSSTGPLGFRFDQTTANRSYAMIVLLGPGQSFPANGAAYTENDNNQVLFVGFNKTGCQLFPGGGPDGGGDSIGLTYSGIEQGLNDLLVSGIISYDLRAGLNKSQTNLSHKNIVHGFHKRAIFNEDGKPDKLDLSRVDILGVSPVLEKTSGSGVGVALSNEFFNKSGEGPADYWSIKDILLYIAHMYGQKNIYIDPLLPKDFQLKNKFSLYVAFVGAIPDDLDNETPSDLDLEGLGVYDAIVETVNQSGKFDIYGGYSITGKFEFRFVPKENRDAREFRTVVSRNGTGVTYDTNKILENCTLNCNREFSQVGRVEVHGARVIVNTLLTSFFEGTDNPQSIFSVTEDVFGAVTGTRITPDDFARNHLKLYPKESLSLDVGVNGLLYNVSSLNWTENEINLPVTAGINSDDNILMFEQFETPEILDEVQPAYSELKSKKKLAASFISDVLNSDSNGKWMFVKPLDTSSIFNIMVDPSDQGGLMMKELIPQVGGKAEEPNGWYDLEKFQTVLESEITNDGKLVHGLAFRKPLPVFYRCSIRTNHRLKGIAEIPGYNPAKHRIVRIKDDRFQLSLSYKDGEYDSLTSGTDKEELVTTNRGTFTAIADGFISLADGSTDPDEDKPITSIQAFAESELTRLIDIPQNTGDLTLTGIQPHFQLGKFITEIEGSSRTFAFPSTVISIRYEYDALKTFVGLGNINEA